MKNSVRQHPCDTLGAKEPIAYRRYPPQTRDGRGLVILLVALAIAAFLVAYLVPVIQRMREKSNLLACRENLRRIGIGLGHYAQSNHGALPVSPTVENPHVQLVLALTAGGFVANPKDFYCPGQKQEDLRYSEQRFRTGVLGYYYYSAEQASDNPALSKFLRTGLAWPRRLDTSMDPRSWVMSDIWISAVPTMHGGFRKGVNYLMLDGSTGFVSESPRQSFH